MSSRTGSQAVKMVSRSGGNGIPGRWKWVLNGKKGFPNGGNLFFNGGNVLFYTLIPVDNSMRVFPFICIKNLLANPPFFDFASM